MYTLVKILFENNVEKSFQLNEIKSFLCSENITDSDLSIQPGVCEQYADVYLYDRTNFLHEYVYGIDRQENKDEVKVSFWCGEDLNNLTLMGTYYASSWDVNGDDNSIHIKCRDKTYLLDSITAEPLPRNGTKTCHQLLTRLFNEMHDCQWEYLDNETSSRCSNITIANCWYIGSTLRELLDKVCYLGMLRIFCINDVFYVGRSV